MEVSGAERPRQLEEEDRRSKPIGADPTLDEQALALAEPGWIDECELVVHPGLAGHGPTLFAGLSGRVDLKLVNPAGARLAGGVAAVGAEEVASGTGCPSRPHHGESRVAHHLTLRPGGPTDFARLPLGARSARPPDLMRSNTGWSSRSLDCFFSR